MGDFWRQWLADPVWTPSLCLIPLQNLLNRFLPDHAAETVWSLVDVGLVIVLTYMMLVIIGERRTLWMVRGFIILMLAAAISTRLDLRLLSFVLNNLVVG